jgi:hypothetical protein
MMLATMRGAGRQQHRGWHGIGHAHPHHGGEGLAVVVHVLALK